MAGHASKNIDAATLWGGKLSPFSTSYGKLMMWFFLISDALTFGGLLTAFGFIRHSYQGEWPIGEKVFHHFPFMGETHMPLIYVAFMTFILIVSSVTMVLAVEAGHRNHKKGVIKWLALTVVGGLIFLGSQVWEWSHFIHGSDFGKIQLADGSWANVHGEFGEVEKLVPFDPEYMTLTALGGNANPISESYAIVAHDEHGGHGHAEEESNEITGGHAKHEYQHALREGDLYAGKFILSINKLDEHGHATSEVVSTDTVKLIKDHHGVFMAVYKGKDKIESLHIMEDGSKYKAGQELEGEKAQAAYDELLASETNSRVIYGATLKENEYGPYQYGQFFFFITGFHGFHVFSGVLINLIILFQVLGGVMERRGHYEMVEKTGLYWHFVDLVWVFVFTFFYLI